MSFNTPLPPGFFDVSDITAVVHEYGGIPPKTVIRTNQAWELQVEWTTTGLLTGWIAGKWDLHIYLEAMGPGIDLDLTDYNEHEIPLTPGTSPVTYKYHPDFTAGRVPPGEYKLVFSVRYIDAAGRPDEMAGHWEGPIITFLGP